MWSFKGGGRIKNRKMTELPIPPEPKELKQKWNEELRRGGGRTNPARVTIKQGTWLTSPLWSEYGWKEQLKEGGINWQKFMELYRNVYHHFISWVEGTITWEDAVQNLIQEIEGKLRGISHYDKADRK